MDIIVAACQNWAIGNHGELLYHIPDDLKRFRNMTTGKVVVYGRKTLETFPYGLALPNRTNVILSRNSELSVPDATVISNLTALRNYLLQFNTDDIFIIGGAHIYAQLLEHCKSAYVTRILATPDEATAYFPNLDEDPRWDCVETGPLLNYDDIDYQFCRYANRVVY